MTEKRFTIESERINNTYSIHIYKDDEVIFEISNWDNLNSMHKKECEELVDYLNKVTNENEQLKQTIENICKDYENAHGMDIRNAEWFNEW